MKVIANIELAPTAVITWEDHERQEYDRCSECGGQDFSGRAALVAVVEGGQWQRIEMYLCMRCLEQLYTEHDDWRAVLNAS